MQSGTTSTWRFAMSNSTSAAGSSVIALVGSTPVAFGAWVHLTGVYTGSGLRLYVNGTQEGSDVHTQTTPASGPVRLGQAVTHASMDQWEGQLDDVRIWQRALGAAEITAEVAGTGQPPSTEYLFDDGTGTVATDSAASGNYGTLSGGGVNWAAGSALSAAGAHLAFTGDVNTQMTSQSKSVRTDRSYTVSARVKLTSTGSFRTAVSQQGTRTSAFFLQYDNGSNAWSFTTTSTDADNAEPRRSLGPAPTLGTWTLLTGVYDAAAGTAQLFVNGVGQTAQTGVTGWHADNGLRVGRALYNGSATDPWLGDIDDVRLWQRALSSDEIVAMASAPRPDVPMTAGLAGALQGTQKALKATTAVAFPATGDTAHTAAAGTSPTTFTLEGWFRLTGNLGGTLLGFDSNASGPAGTSDRMLYVTSTGAVRFQSTRTSGLQSAADGYNDGAWHHMAVSVSATAGTVLYLDGVAVASSTSVKPSTTYTGYWRLGSGSLAGYPFRPPSDTFRGTLDEVATYATALDAQAVSQHYYANY